MLSFQKLIAPALNRFQVDMYLKSLFNKRNKLY